MQSMHGLPHRTRRCPQGRLAQALVLRRRHSRTDTRQRPAQRAARDRRRPAPSERHRSAPRLAPCRTRRAPRPSHCRTLAHVGQPRNGRRRAGAGSRTGAPRSTGPPSPPHGSSRSGDRRAHRGTAPTPVRRRHADPAALAGGGRSHRRPAAHQARLVARPRRPREQGRPGALSTPLGTGRPGEGGEMVWPPREPTPS